MSKSILRCIFIFLCLVLVELVEARVSVMSRGPDHYLHHSDEAEMEASSCLELHNALASETTSRVKIVLIENLECSKEQWSDIKRPVSINGDRIVQGMKSSKDNQTTSIRLDLSQIPQGVILKNGANLYLNNLIIICAANSAYDASVLTFVRLSQKHSTVHIAESMIVTQSCDKFQNQFLLSEQSRVLDKSVSNEQRRDQVKFLSGEYKGLSVCQSQLYCQQSKNLRYPEKFNPQFNAEDACSEDILSLLNSPSSSLSASSEDKFSKPNSSKKRRIITSTLVAFFSFFLLVPGIIMWWKLAHNQRIRKHGCPSNLKESTATSNSASGNNDADHDRSSESFRLTPPSYIIKLGNITIDTSQELGTGGFGTVYEGTYGHDHAAIKIIRSEGMDGLQTFDDKDHQHLHHEAVDDREWRISQSLKHPNVVQTFDYQEINAQEVFGEFRAQESESCKVIALEYCDKGELSRAIDRGEYVLNFSSLQPNMSAILYSALDIAKGLEYIHSLSIVHGDLKPDNILRKSDKLDPRGYICKICDFGLSRTVGDILAETDTLGMISYMPPELLRKGYVGKFTDVYSFGMLLWEMATSDVPFAEVDYNQIVLETINGRRPHIPENTPSTVLNLIKECWDSDYSNRPTATDIIKRLHIAVSEWYSAFPPYPIKLSMESPEVYYHHHHWQSDIFLTPPIFTARSTNTRHDLDSGCDESISKCLIGRQRKPAVKQCSYYEIRKQVQLASAPCAMWSKEIQTYIEPLKNEDMLIPPLFPSDPSKDEAEDEYSTTIRKDGESTEVKRSHHKNFIPHDNKKTNVQRAGKKSSMHTSYSSLGLAAFIPDTTPRSTLAGFYSSVSNNRPYSASSSGIDPQFETLDCKMYIPPKDTCETPSYKSESQDLDEI